MSAVETDVVVIGGGAMGSAAAWHLARRGIDTVLLERFAPGHTFGASHGSSRIFRTSYAEPVYVQLAREAEREWAVLEAESGLDLLTVTGGVDQGHGAASDAIAATLTVFGVAHDRLPPEEAARRWPGLRFTEPVLHYPNSGRLHADRAVAALQQQASAAGAVVRHEVPVSGIRVGGDDHVEVAFSGPAGEERITARRVVVAAGAWAEDLLADLVPLPRIVVTQEQPAHFTPVLGGDALAWPTFSHQPPAGAPGSSEYGGIYGLSSGAEGIKVGFHGVGPRVHPDRRDFTAEPVQLAALRDYVRHWLPGVDPDSAVPISCTYATTDDSNFVIDRRGPVVVAAGFSGHGFKFVPAVGRLLADLVVGRAAPSLFSLRHRLERTHA